MKVTPTNIGNERAVSPVVGVILMVAITVILAAVIGTFVLNLGSDQTEPARAGIDFEQINNNIDVRMTVTDSGNVDSLEYTVNGGSATAFGGTSTGTTVTATGLVDGDIIRVIGTNNGKENIVADYEV